MYVTSARLPVPAILPRVTHVALGHELWRTIGMCHRQSKNACLCCDIEQLSLFNGLIAFGTNETLYTISAGVAFPMCWQFANC